MTATVFDTMKVTSPKRSHFTANGSQIKFLTIIWAFTTTLIKTKCFLIWLKVIRVKKVVTTPEQHFTQPPARAILRSDTGLLEENGSVVNQHAPTAMLSNVATVKLVAKRFEPTRTW